MMKSISALYLLIVVLLIGRLHAAILTTITISQFGLDTPSCLTNQEEPCHSLNYTLIQLEETQPSQDVIIIVTYSHSISPVNVTYSSDLNISIVAAGPMVIHCTQGGYIHIDTLPNIREANVSVSIDGLQFDDCRGHLFEDKKVYGFHLSNIDKFSMKNSIISNSGDLLLERTRQVYIGSSQFMKNKFFYGQISLVQQLSKNGSGPPSKSSSYIIEDSLFIDNIGQYQSESTPSATLAYYIQPVNLNYTVFGIVRRCIFSNNSINTDIDISYKTISEIAIMLPFCKAKHVSFSFEQNTFTNSHGNYGRIIWAGLYSPDVDDFQIYSNSNVFKNNDVSNFGQLIALYFSDLTKTRVNTIIRNNTIMSNIGNAIDIQHFNVTRSGTIHITDSIFKNNKGAAIILSRDFCPYEMFSIVNISNITVANNSMSSLLNNGVVSITNQTIFLSDSNFTNNTGTALYIHDTILYPSGQLAFIHNVGRNGGGVVISTATTVKVYSPTSVNFLNNVALYGGAIYISISERDSYGEWCFIEDDDCNLNVHSSGNKASSSGSNIFFSDPNTVDNSCWNSYLHRCFNISNQYNSQLGFGSSVSSITAISSNTNIKNTMKLFPGQNIVINASLYGVFGKQSSCIATVYLGCNDQIITCQGSNNGLLQLQGSTEISLSYKVFTSDLKLLSSDIDDFEQYSSPTLRFKCRYTNEEWLYLKIVSCPLGFLYNQSALSCQCAWSDHSGYICSLAAGHVCVIKGYWYGTLSKDGQDFFTMAKCEYTNCKDDKDACPTGIGADQGTSMYSILPAKQDDQCDNYHGGILCTRCNNEAAMSFQGVQCVPLSKCRPWQPYIILVLVILFQLLLSLLIIIIISTTFSFGLGYLYGPLFYIAVISRLSFGYYAEFYVLKIITSFYTSVFLLNMEIFGEIPWCFFSSLSLLEDYAFHYLGSLIVGIVLLISVIVARKYPRIHRKITTSPVHSICIFLLLSFWSLSDTSIRILKFKRFTSGILTTVRVTIDPEIVFFTGAHIPLALIAIGILLIIILPFMLLLLFSPCLGMKVNLFRIKPLLDQFQACCQDNYRWYPGLYMIIWILILVFDYFTIAIQLLLVLITGIHFLLQSYQNKWLNALDMLLLCDLILIVSFVNEKNNPTYIYSQDEWINTIIVVATYILTIIPLLAFLLGVICIILHRFNVLNFAKMRKLVHRKTQVSFHPEPINSSLVEPQETTGNQFKKQVLELHESTHEYREPLLALLSDDEQVLPQQYGSRTNK